MTFRIYLRSGSEIVVNVSDWKKFFEIINNTTDKGNEKNAERIDMFFHDDNFPFMVCITDISAIVPERSLPPAASSKGKVE